MICIYTIGNIERDPVLNPLSIEILEMWRFESLFLQIWRVGYRVNAELWNVKVEGWPSWELDKIKEKMPQWAKIKRINDGLSVPKKKEKNKISNSILMLLELLPILHPKLDLVFCLFLHKFCDHLYLEVIKLLQCTNLKKILISNTLSHFFFLPWDFFWYTIFGGRHFFLFFWRGNVDFFLVKVHTYRKVKITFVTKEESARKWGTDKKALLWPKSDQKVQNGQKTL